jgi:filamentous hemagglutinin family protein
MNLKSRPSWNRLARRDIALSESNFTIAPDAARRHTLGRRVAMLSLLASALGMTGLAYASGGPTGGQIVGGSGQIQQVGNTTTIHQNSSTLSLNWQSFNIGPDQTVNFVQPGSNAIAINRIFASTPSEIYGHLNANGHVWLINPNGVLFGQSAQVNVGGLVASTLDVDDSTIDSSNRRFSGSGKGSIVNRGSINASNGGYVALIGNQVSNQGVITAQLGTVALGGGSAVTLTFNGNQLLHLQVDRSTLNNLAENRQLIVADGGHVIMTAGAKDALLASVVNNTGRVQAQTVQNHDGTITLLGGMEAGTVNVGGTLDASAPNGGKGGFIETSGAQAHIADGSVITTKAVGGKDGTWLVDPTDFTIAASGGDITASTLESQLANGNVAFTSANGAGGTSGNVNVNQAVTWSANTTLTLTASNNVNLNAAITNTGASGKTVLNAGNAFVNNVGASGLGGNWAIYSASPTATGENLGSLTPGFIQYNAPIGTAAAAGATGNGVFYSVAPALSVSGLTGTVTKTYDGTTSAPLVGANFITSGMLTGDKIVSAAGTYTTSDAGSNIAVTSPSSISGYSITNAAGIPIYGYALSGVASANIGTINPAQLTASIIGNPTKVYDGTTTATLNSSNYQISGFVAGQGATVNQPSTIGYANGDAGSEALNATFTLTNFVANSGTNLSNYILPANATGMGTITQAPVVLSGLLANSKVYDGSTLASLNLSNASIFGVIAGDASNVTLNTGAGTGNFASANAGNNIAVNVSGFTLTGTRASNYQLIAPTDLTANITPKALTVSGVTANNKVYDGTTADTLNFGSATLNGIVGSDNVALSGSASGTFSQSDVGNNLAVSVSGFGLTGTAAGNYTVTQPSGLIANITPRHLTIAFNGSPAKIYDGTDNATLGSSDFTLSGFVGSESAVVSQSPAVYASPNAGVGISVTATLQPSDFTVGSGTKLSNYSFDNTVTGTGTINPAPLTVSIVNNPTKVYDSTTIATLGSGNYVLSGRINGENITFNGPTTGTYASANAGVEAVSATLSSANFTASGGALLSNYALPTAANGFGTITPAPLSGTLVASLINTITKVYDGTNTYLLNATSGGGTSYTQDFALSGFKGSDSAYVNANITGYFASKNVGNNQPFQVTLNSSDLTFTSGSASNYTSPNSFPIAIYSTGSITPAPLTVSLIGNLNKVYDGSTVAQLTSANFQANGFVAGEGATITPTATFSYADKNAGSGIGISGNLTANNYTATGSTLLSNYTLATSATGTGNITQAPLFVTGVYATNKVYDTTASDTLNVSAAGLSGLVAGDVGSVTLNTSTSGTFAQSNVGNGIAVTANGFSISGTEAANYILQPISGLAANITPKGLTISGVTATDKIYDGTTADTLSGTGTLNGVLGSDNVTLVSSGAGGTFSTANVGNNLSVTISGFTLSGAQAGNYTVAQPGGLTASITPRQLTATITGSPTKVYDGSDSATLTAGDYTLTGFVIGQGASVPQSATAHYGTSSTSIVNAGTGLSVYSTLVVSDFVANAGTNLANYILPTNASGNNGVINPYVLNLTGTRVYDATTGANASLFGSNGVITTGIHSETVNVSGSGVLVTKNVGSQRAFANLGSLTLGDGTNGGLASNYTLVGGTDWVTITPALLTVSGTVAANKVYDNTTEATISGSTLNGVLGSDSVTLGNTTSGTFATKNVGNGIAVSTNMSISGTDAGNYIIQQPTGVTANITPLAITVTATGTNRQYNGLLSDTVTLAGTLAGDSVTINDTSSNFADANVGNGKTVTVSGISLSGASAGNYTLNNTSTTTTADITPRILDLSGTRVYDATTSANSSLFSSGGTLNGVNGETLTLSGTGTVSSKNIGTYTGSSFVLNTLALGNGTGLASNYTLVGGTDTLTITPATLTVSGTVAANKIYDGTTAASLSGSVLNGVLGTDSVTLGNDTVGQFNTKDVGTGKPVSTSMTVSGGDAGNYVLVQPTGITADITKLAITVTATGTNRVYDGTVNDAVTLAGTLAGDNVTINDTSSTFADANVGTGKTVTVNGISLGGASAGNYTLNNTSTTTTADITPVKLDLTGTRVYDSTTGASASLFGNNGVLTGVNGETLTLSGTGTLSTANAGTHQTFAANGLTGFTLTGNNGALASNYTLTGGTDWVTITPYVLDLSGTRVYNATTGAAASLFGNGVLTGVNSETVNLSGSGVLSSKNVGTQGFANLGTLALSNGSGLAANYTLVGGTDSVTVTPYVLNLSGTRVYDATTGANASLFGSNGTLTGVSGETVKLSGSGVLNSKNVGTEAFANFGTLALSNGTGLASNYTLVGGTDSVNVTPYVLNLSATRVYDTTTNADANLFGSNGTLTGLSGETLALTGVGTVSSKNVGAYTAANFQRNTLALSDGSGLASNYTLTGGSDSLTITPATLSIIGTTVQTRQYDATTVAQLSGAQLQGILGSDNVVLGNAVTGTFASPNAGTSIPVSTTMTIGGTDAGNYTYAQPTGLTGTIDPRVLSLAGTRVYDATTGADANLFGSNGVIAGVNSENVKLSGSGVLSSKDVGTQGFANLGTLALSDGTGLASNYTLAGGTDTVTVTPYVLNLTSTRVYDGTAVANANLFGSNGTLTGVNGETLVLGGSGMLSTKNVGTQQSFAANGLSGFTLTGNGGALASNYTLTGGTDWVTITPYVLNLIGTRMYDAGTDANASLFGNGVLAGVGSETVNLSGSGVLNSKNVGVEGFANFGTLGLSDGTGGGLAGNYTLVGGTDAVTVTKAPLIVTGTVASDKIYDGNDVAQLSGATLSGVLGSDNVTLGNAATGTFASKNVGNNIAVSTSMTIGGTDSGNYDFTLPTGITANITPKVLDLVSTRVYDANTDANASLFGNGVLVGVNGETVNLSGSGVLNSKNVGVEGFANLGTLSLSDGTGGGLAGNYTLIGGTDSVTITKAPLTVTGTVAANKIYDGNDTAQLSGATLSGLLGSDDVTLGNASTGTFASKNVGNNIAVSTGMTISGADIGNYDFTLPTGITANITPYVLNLIGTRVYDGNTDANASLFGSNGVLSTGIGTETVNLSGSGVLTSKHVGTRGFANRGTLVLSDGTGLASNYTLVGGTDQVTITPRNIVVDATGHDKTYDGNTTAGVTLGSNGVLAGDVVNFHDGAANFSTPNAGSNVSIAVTGITASGADAGDYAFNGNTATSATINPYVLNLTSTRVYDGTTGAAANLFGNSGVLTGVNGETVDLAGTGVLTSKNVGSQRAFAKLGSLVLGNGTGLASNYTLAGGSDWVSITPATLTVVGTTTTNRVYDGTRVDALNGSTLSGVFGNDDVVLGNDSTGLFVDKNVGNGKAVATAMTISGSDVGNYILMQPTGLFANITPMPIVVTATGTNRMYNGKTDDVISLSTNGVLAGDQVALVNTSAQFADPYVGNDKTVTVSGVAAVGADAANYLIVDPTTTATANITSAGFNGSGVQGSWIAQLQAGLEPEAIATPYGSSDSDTVGVYTGNHQLKHRPIERNRAHSDFHPGLSLHFQNGGVRLPADASP